MFLLSMIRAYVLAPEQKRGYRKEQMLLSLNRGLYHRAEFVVSEATSGLTLGFQCY